MAWVEDAQAVVVQKFAPLKPVFMEIVPAAIFPIIMGMKKTEILSGPFSRYLECS